MKYENNNNSAWHCNSLLFLLWRRLLLLLSLHLHMCLDHCLCFLVFSNLFSLILNFLLFLFHFWDCLWSYLSLKYLLELFKSETLGFSQSSSALHIFFSEWLIHFEICKHFTDISHCHSLAVATYRFEEELYVLRVLHVVLLLDDWLIVQNLLRSENCFRLASTHIQSFTNASQECSQLSCLILETERLIAVYHFRYF